MYLQVPKEYIWENLRFVPRLEWENGGTNCIFFLKFLFSLFKAVFPQESSCIMELFCHFFRIYSPKVHPVSEPGKNLSQTACIAQSSTRFVRWSGWCFAALNAGSARVSPEQCTDHLITWGWRWGFQYTGLVILWSMYIDWEGGAWKMGRRGNRQREAGGSRFVSVRASGP